MAADGSIVINTEIDTKDAQKELNKLQNQIEKMEKSLSEDTTKQSSIEAELKAAQDEALKTTDTIRRLKRELASERSVTSIDGTSDPTRYIESLSRQEQITAELQQQEALLKVQDKDAERLANEYTKIYDRVQSTTTQLDRAKMEAGALQRRLAQAPSALEMMGPAIERAQKSMNRFSLRLREVIRSALIFTVISQTLASFREWMGKVIKTNDEANAAFARLRGALLTLAQPLVNVIIPALTALANILTNIISVVAQLVSFLFGTTVEASSEAAENLYNETEALEGVGAAADEAGKSMASFDEINQLSGAGASSGGRAAETTAPVFDLESTLDDGVLSRILELVKMIGSALLAWQISSTLGLGLRGLLGLFLAIYSAISFVQNMFDAWVNGVSWDNLNGMLLSALGLAVGLYVALGPVAAGISLVVTGLAMLVTGIHDAVENGWSLENLLLSIAGIFATGLGIGLITGSWIPLLISSIASLLLAITTTFGDGEKLIEDAKKILQGFIDFFAGVFTGDLDLAISGIGEIFDGLRGIVDNVLTAIQNMFLSFLDWLDEKTGGRISGLINLVKNLLTAFVSFANSTIGGLLNGIQQMLNGLITFISGVFSGDWDKAWSGIVELFKGAINTLISMVESFVNFFIDGVNAVINALNSISITVPDWVPGIGGNYFGFNIPPLTRLQLPRLAQGAVIPPNREFLAVLGDQKQGTNIEAPLSTIEQAVANVMNRMGYGGEQTVILQVDKDQLGKVVYRLNKAETRRIGVNLAGV